jgi:hypothetical protein
MLDMRLLQDTIAFGIERSERLTFVQLMFNRLRRVGVPRRRNHRPDRVREPHRSNRTTSYSALPRTMRNVRRTTDGSCSGATCISAISAVRERWRANSVPARAASRL